MNLLEIKRLQRLAGIIRESDGDVPAVEVPGLEPPTPTPPSTTQTKTISREEAVNLIRETRGKFFTVTFIKKDGSTRVMNARLGVQKHLKGGELRYVPGDKGLICVYDMQAGGYRMVNQGTINKLVIGKDVYDVR